MAVVLIGYGDIPEFEYLTEEIEDSGGETIIWDLKQWPGETPVTYEIGTDEQTVESVFSFDSVDGIFLYRNYLFKPLEGRFHEKFQNQDIRQAYVQLKEWRSIFDSFLPKAEAEGANVIAPPRMWHWHFSKPAQLKRFRKAGVPVPPTVFTNEPETVRDFVDEHQEVVYKPITYSADPQRIESDDLDEQSLEKLAAAPVQFQAYAPGDDVRVYTLEEEVIGASKFRTEGWSFRDSKVLGAEEVDLDPRVVEQIERVAEDAPVSFSAVDIRLDGDEFNVLESAPHPRFSFHEAFGSVNVSTELAQYLME